MTRGRRLPTVGLLGVLALAVACSAPDEGAEGVPDAERAAEAEAAEAPSPDTAESSSLTERLARLDDLREDGTGRSLGDFPHDAHRRIECSACHPDPAGHATHEMIRCGECHATPGTEASVPSAAECMGCHHAESRTDDCTRCHDDPGGPPDVRVTQTVDVAGTTDDPVRDLLFRHALHDTFSCTTCHRTGDTFGVDRDCASCHDDHHRPDADCLSCHAPLPLRAHAPEAHGGCGGSTCHTDPTVLELPPTRSVCLSCHQSQTEHEPGLQCDGCHRVTEPTNPAPSDAPMTSRTEHLLPSAPHVAASEAGGRP